MSMGCKIQIGARRDVRRSSRTTGGDDAKYQGGPAMVLIVLGCLDHNFSYKVMSLQRCCQGMGLVLVSVSK